MDRLKSPRHVEEEKRWNIRDNGEENALSSQERLDYGVPMFYKLLDVTDKRGRSSKIIGK